MGGGGGGARGPAGVCRNGQKGLGEGRGEEWRQQRGSELSTALQRYTRWEPSSLALGSPLSSWVVAHAGRVWGLQ